MSKISKISIIQLLIAVSFSLIFPAFPTEVTASSEGTWILPVRATAYYYYKPACAKNVCNPENILKEDGKGVALVRKMGSPREKIAGKTVSACVIVDFGELYLTKEVEMKVATIKSYICNDNCLGKGCKKGGKARVFYSKDGAKWKYLGLVRRGPEDESFRRVHLKKRLKKGKELRYILVCRYGGSHRYANVAVDVVRIKGEAVLPPPSIPPPSGNFYIRITSPNGGEKLYNQGVYDITWKSSGVQTVSIYLVTEPEEEGLEPIEMLDEFGSWKIAKGIPAQPGKYTWYVRSVVGESFLPDPFRPGEYRIVIEAEPVRFGGKKIYPEIYDVSDSSFRIVNTPLSDQLPPSLPDLTINRVKIKPSRAILGAILGDKLKFTVWVKNVGGKMAKNIKISIRDQNGFGGEGVIRKIGPTHTKKRTVTLKLYRDDLPTYNPHYFKIKIDPQNKINEWKEDNNEGWLIIPILPWLEQAKEDTPPVVALGSKNKPVSGTLSISPGIVKRGERVRFTVQGKDGDGVWELRMWRKWKLFQPGSWFVKTYKKYCKGKTSCKKTWRIRFKKAGNYTYCAAVIGKAPAGQGGMQRLEGRYTDPRCVTVKVKK